MGDPFGKEYINTFKKLLQTNVPAAAAKIEAYLDKQDNIPLNIAITGECGSGKSTFVNAFRGLDKKDKSDAAAPTGSVETTKEVKPYPHPNFPNVTLWDLPGIGTTNFPAAKYLEYVGFERFDFFIIISAVRFTENDVKLALEIQKMKKKFYFVLSKIDQNMRDGEATQREFNAEKSLSIIRENCINGLLKHRIESPQVFLVSCFDLHLYDFHLLTKTLERELPAHKMRAMRDPFHKEDINTFKELLQNNVAAATAKIKAYLEEQDNTPLNIAITGECGSGKSTFVNAFRGLDNKDQSDAAAPTGSVETTMEVKSYPHPNFPDVTLWDLPGIGTTNFPAAKYLKHVGFERFDFFIIISADRFTENDVKLALEIQKMKKKFYFVRSKIDQNMRAEEKTQSEFNAEKSLSIIKESCVNGLLKLKIESPQVFLVSSFDLHLYDFHLLTKTLERELPAHKRDALLLAIPNVHFEIIHKKKEALKAKIKYLASLSALTAAVPVPGLSFAVDVVILVKATLKYKRTFGLDNKSMANLALKSGVPLTDLRAVMTSNLSVDVINIELIRKLLLVSGVVVASMASEEVSRFIPLIGIPAAAAISFTCTYISLKDCLNMLAEDAQRVFKKALGSNSSV